MERGGVNGWKHRDCQVSTPPFLSGIAGPLPGSDYLMTRSGSFVTTTLDRQVDDRFFDANGPVVRPFSTQDLLSVSGRSVTLENMWENTMDLKVWNLETTADDISAELLHSFRFHPAAARLLSERGTEDFLVVHDTNSRIAILRFDTNLQRLPIGDAFGTTNAIRGRRYSEWLGYYDELAAGWVWNDEHGFLWPVRDKSGGGVWMFSPEHGWAWTHESIYPNLLAHPWGWCRFERTETGVRTFFRYDAGFWEDTTPGHAPYIVTGRTLFMDFGDTEEHVINFRANGRHDIHVSFEDEGKLISFKEYHGRFDYEKSFSDGDEATLRMTYRVSMLGVDVDSTFTLRFTSPGSGTFTGSASTTRFGETEEHASEGNFSF